MYGKEQMRPRELLDCMARNLLRHFHHLQEQAERFAAMSFEDPNYKWSLEKFNDSISNTLDRACKVASAYENAGISLPKEVFFILENLSVIINARQLLVRGLSNEAVLLDDAKQHIAYAKFYDHAQRCFNELDQSPVSRLLANQILSRILLNAIELEAVFRHRGLGIPSSLMQTIREALPRFLRTIEPKKVLEEGVLIRRAQEALNVFDMVTTASSRARTRRPEQAFVVCAGGSITAEASSSSTMVAASVTPTASDTDLRVESIPHDARDSDLQVTDCDSPTEIASLAGSSAEDFERLRRRFFGPSRFHDRRDQHALSASASVRL